MRKLILDTPKPHLDCARAVRRFLWLPLTLLRGDGQKERRWLERATILQVYQMTTFTREVQIYDRFEIEDFLAPAWCDVSWAPEQAPPPDRNWGGFDSVAKNPPASP